VWHTNDSELLPPLPLARVVAGSVLYEVSNLALDSVMLYEDGFEGT